MRKDFKKGLRRIKINYYQIHWTRWDWYWREHEEHREDGPFYIYYGPNILGVAKIWKINGKYHRDPEEGPAVIGIQGWREWWVHGEKEKRQNP